MVSLHCGDDIKDALNVAAIDSPVAMERPELLLDQLLGVNWFFAMCQFAGHARPEVKGEYVVLHRPD